MNPILELIVSNNKIEFQAEKSLQYKGRKWSPVNAKELLLDPDLKTSPLALSSVLFHFFLDEQYKLITDAEKYKQFYIETEHSFGTHNVETIDKPALKGESLNFYVSTLGTDVPYLVSVNLKNLKFEINDLPTL